jgi:hypothetical protein
LKTARKWIGCGCCSKLHAEATQDFASSFGGLCGGLARDPAQRRMRDVFVKNCTTCHTPALVLQNLFDQAGWEAIITMMSRINAQGEVSAASARPHPVISHYKKELAAYLAEVRGPATSPMKFRTGARPAGEATLPVIYEYDPARTRRLQ